MIKVKTENGEQVEAVNKIYRPLKQFIDCFAGTFPSIQTFNFKIDVDDSNPPC